MCLTSITQTFDPADPTPRIGYKVFLRSKAGNYNGYLGPFFGRRMDVGVEIQAEKMVVQIGNEWSYIRDSKYYTSGFHVFPALEAATVYAKSLDDMEIDEDVLIVICKVSYRNTIHIGMQNGNKCHVAEHMTILEKVGSNS